jgi:hypothetical protein
MPVEKRPGIGGQCGMYGMVQSEFTMNKVTWLIAQSSWIKAGKFKDQIREIPLDKNTSYKYSLLVHAIAREESVFHFLW